LVQPGKADVQAQHDSQHEPAQFPYAANAKAALDQISNKGGR
jgi:hypothetical protein